jgi:hypothetical protein
MRIDFRFLHAVTKFQVDPLPLVKDTISCFHGSRFFLVLQCFSGVFQVEIDEEHKQKTTFSVPSSGL